MSINYLDYILPPLLHDIAKHNVIPVLGSGFSRNARGLSGERKMPLWKDLGVQFAEIIHKDYRYDGNPTNAISRFVEIYGKVSLADHLREFLHVGEAKPGEAHHYFTQLPFDLIITTNFDKLIEYAYMKMGITPHIIHEAKYLSQNIEERPKIIKIHGDLNYPDSIIITNEDYRSSMKSDLPLYPFNISLGTFALGISIGDYYILDDNQISRFREFRNQYNDLLINKILDYKRYEQDKYSNIKVAMENFLRAYARTDGTNISIL